MYGKIIKECILKLKQGKNDICYKLLEDTKDYQLYQLTDKNPQLDVKKPIIISLDEGERKFKFGKIKSKTSFNKLNKPNVNSQKYLDILLPIIFPNQNKHLNRSPPNNNNRHLTRPPPNNVQPKTNFPRGYKKDYSQPRTPTNVLRNQIQRGINRMTKPLKNTSISVLNHSLDLLGKGMNLLGAQIEQKYHEYQTYQKQQERQRYNQEQKRKAEQFEKEMKKKINDYRRKAKNFFYGVTSSLNGRKRGGGNQYYKFPGSDYYLVLEGEKPEYVLYLKPEFKNKVNQEIKKNLERKEIQLQQQIRNYLIFVNKLLVKAYLLNTVYQDFYKVYVQSKFLNQEKNILEIDTAFEELLFEIGKVVDGIKNNQYSNLNNFNLEIIGFENLLKDFCGKFLNDLLQCQKSIEGTAREGLTTMISKIGINKNFSSHCQKIYRQNFSRLKQEYSIFMENIQQQEINYYLSTKNDEDLIKLMHDTIERIVNLIPQNYQPLTVEEQQQIRNQQNQEFHLGGKSVDLKI